MKKEEIHTAFENLSAPRKVEVLWIALDYMNQYNGRTKYECVRLAMENIYNYTEDED